MDLNFTENLTDCSNFLHPQSPLKDPYFQGGVYSMYAIIFLVAFMGNSFICYVVLASPRMRTVTNYFIMNLAVGDMLITILCVPFTSVALMKQYWPFGSVLCPVVNYCQALSVFISAYTLVAISIDKYMVIMWPLKPRISKGFATSIIALVWLVAGTTVLPTGTFAKTMQPPNDMHYVYCDRYICKEDYSDVGQEYGLLYSKILMVMQYVVPSIVLLFTYTSIAAVIWCHRIPGEAENSRDMRIAKSKRKMVKMMVTVVMVYSLCWLPYNVLMVTSDLVSDRVMMYLYFPLHGLAMSHACYNPIIYCFMNSRFREALFLLLRNIPCLKTFHTRSASSRQPDLLKKSAPSRIINVASEAAKYAKLTSENLNVYPGPLLNYYNSKLANILFTIKLAELLRESNVSVFSLHPGAVKTEILRKLPLHLKLIFDPVVNLLFKTPEEGAQTTLHTSLEQGIEHLSGKHFDECTMVSTYGTAKDHQLIETIWNKTMVLINCVDEVKKLS